MVIEPTVSTGSLSFSDSTVGSSVSRAVESLTVSDLCDALRDRNVGENLDRDLVPDTDLSDLSDRVSKLRSLRGPVVPKL